MNELIVFISLQGFISILLLSNFFPISLDVNGWKLIYLCLLFGLINLFATHILSLIPYLSSFNYFFNENIFVPFLNDINVKSHKIFKLIPLGIPTSILISSSWGKFYTSYLRPYINKRNSFFKELLEIQENDQLLLLTLRDKKIFICSIYKIQFDIDSDNRHIEILPYVSGYRDEQHKITWTVDYIGAIKKDHNVDNIHLKNLKITIFQSEISRFSRFNEKLASSFKFNFDF